MTNREAAAWARAYADELAKGGWTDDAARFYRQAAALEKGQRQAEVERTWRGLISGEIEDEELSRLFLGSALDPEPYEPSTKAATE